MRLEPSHRLLVGVNGASLVSVPLVLLLLVVLHMPQKNVLEQGRAAVSPPSPAGIVPAPSAAGSGTVAEALQPQESVRETAHQHKQATVHPKKIPVERVLYSARWTAGEIRRKIAGKMPQYPAGFTGEAMVRVELVVSPAGNVRAAKLLQIGNARCDEVTLREVRLWKFQPLPPRQKRADHRCVVIVSFTRK